MHPKPSREMDSVYRACKWFNFASVLFTYVILLAYASIWLSSSPQCTYNFPAPEAWNCALWNFAIYVIWWPLVGIYLLCIHELIRKAHWNGGFYPHVSRMSILHCLFVIAYTILCGVRVGSLPLDMAATAGNVWKSEEIQIIVVTGMSGLILGACVLVILLAVKTVRDIVKVGVKDYEDEMAVKCEMGKVEALGVEEEGRLMADEADRMRSDDGDGEGLESDAEGSL